MGFLVASKKRPLDVIKSATETLVLQRRDQCVQSCSDPGPLHNYVNDLYLTSLTVNITAAIATRQPLSPACIHHVEGVSNVIEKHYQADETL